MFAPTHSSRALSSLRLLAITALLALTLLALATAGAQAASCTPPKYPGSGYFTSLSVSKTSCAQGSKVARGHYSCRIKNGKKGKCASLVSGYRCTEKRVAVSTEFNSRVTCTKGSGRIVFTYQQNL